MAHNNRDMHASPDERHLPHDRAERTLARCPGQRQLRSVVRCGEQDVRDRHLSGLRHDPNWAPVLGAAGVLAPAVLDLQHVAALARGMTGTVDWFAFGPMLVRCCRMPPMAGALAVGWAVTSAGMMVAGSVEAWRR
jgi:hypothetical protein